MSKANGWVQIYNEMCFGSRSVGEIPVKSFTPRGSCCSRTPGTLKETKLTACFHSWSVILHLAQMHREVYDHSLRDFTKQLCQSDPVLCRTSVLQCLEEGETAPDLFPRFSETLFALTVPHRHCRGYSRQWWVAEESLRLSLRYVGLAAHGACPGDQHNML